MAQEEAATVRVLSGIHDFCSQVPLKLELPSPNFAVHHEEPREELVITSQVAPQADEEGI